MKRLLSFKGNFDEIGASMPLSGVSPESALELYSKRNMSALSFLPQLTDSVARLLEIVKIEMGNFAIASHKGKKPLNPIIGETLEATYGSVAMKAEQLQHHPPISGIVYYADGVSYIKIVDASFSLGSGGFCFKISERNPVRLIVNDIHYEIGVPDLIIVPNA